MPGKTRLGADGYPCVVYFLISYGGLTKSSRVIEIDDDGDDGGGVDGNVTTTEVTEVGVCRVLLAFLPALSIYEWVQ